jgi:hypothetical protein
MGIKILSGRRTGFRYARETRATQGKTRVTLEAGMKDDSPPPPKPDYYFEHGFLVYTADFHLKRGSCCGSGCRHCPFIPPHLEGNTVVGNTKAG